MSNPYLDEIRERIAALTAEIERYHQRARDEDEQRLRAIGLCLTNSAYYTHAKRLESERADLEYVLRNRIRIVAEREAAAAMDDEAEHAGDVAHALGEAA